MSFQKFLENVSYQDALIGAFQHGIISLDDCDLPLGMCASLKEKDKPLIIFGASDDILEFSGGIDDEFTAYNADYRIVTSLGTHLRFWWDCAYGFKIQILQSAAFENVTLDQPEESLYDAEGYNGHRATITPCPEWVAFGEYFPIQGDSA